ncbi:hypothetical protein [Saccharicrinis sp. FJH54]|uniref:hypothetical protein n=1 Tax=Saccharicrinis sp. FJH54 TaxID=3344665 RepID=UPI0035D4E93B
MELLELKSEFENVLNLVLSSDYACDQNSTNKKMASLLKESEKFEKHIMFTLAYAGFLCRRLTNANNYVYWKLLEATDEELKEFKRIRLECLTALAEINESLDAKFNVMV